MPIYFDEIIDRRNTSSIKYDFAAVRGYPEGILPFWVADMDFRVPAPIMEALKVRTAHGIFGYTQPMDDYFAAIQSWFATRHNWNVTASDLIITPGVVFALATAIRTFTQPGDAVLIQQPVYYPFANIIRENARRLVNSQLRLLRGRYMIDFNDFEQKIIENKVKLFILCSPHNPVGRVWTHAELAQLADICLRHNVLVIADEIHEEFIRPGFRHTNPSSAWTRRRSGAASTSPVPHRARHSTLRVCKSPTSSSKMNICATASKKSCMPPAMMNRIHSVLQPLRPHIRMAHHG